MPRMADLDCQVCEYKIRDLYLADPPEVFVHKADDGTVHTMEYVYVPRIRNAEWSDRDSVVVFKDAKGQLRYPGRNDLPTPQGCARIVMKSLREVERFERQYGVRNEAAWYDSGSGTKRPDDEFVNRMPSEEQRRDSFMKAWRQ